MTPEQILEEQRQKNSTLIEIEKKRIEKMKARQEEQLGSIDDVHPMKQVAVMSVIQVLMLATVGAGMFFIGLNY